MGKIIAIANQKEALENYYISKSSRLIRVLEKKKITIDADPQANASSGLGLDVESVEIGTNPRAQPYPKDAIVNARL
jgi:chromosome partitioning protein